MADLADVHELKQRSSTSGSLDKEKYSDGASITEKVAVDADVDDVSEEVIEKAEDVAVAVCIRNSVLGPTCSRDSKDFICGGRPRASRLHVPVYLLGHRSERVHVCTGHDLHVQAAERVRLAALLSDYRVCARHGHAHRNALAWLLALSQPRALLHQVRRARCGRWRARLISVLNREHTIIVIMSSTASNVALGMEIVAALGMLSVSRCVPCD